MSDADSPTADHELDRRYPERVRVRQMRTASDYRETRDVVEQLWADTVEFAERLPEPARQERVDDEWSFVETLRHLVFATDMWAGGLVLGQAHPYHPLALPPTDFPPYAVEAMGLDPGARPGYTEVKAVWAERVATLRDIIDGLDDETLRRPSAGSLPAEWNEPDPSVGECLRVVLEEQVEHRRYAMRDLAVLAAR